MSSLGERAAAALVRRQKAAWGVAVTYARAGSGPLSLTAVPGATVYQSAPDGAGVRQEVSERDYLVAVADLTLGTPALGDRVTETINGTAVTFEVATPKNGEPEWRYSSQWNVLYRIHCKRV